MPASAFQDLAPNQQYELLALAARRHTEMLAKGDDYAGAASAWADVIREMLDHPEWPPPFVYECASDGGLVFPPEEYRQR